MIFILKKRYLSLALLLAVILSISAHAQTYMMRKECDLSFEGSTAYCSVTIKCDKSTDEISALVKLWDGSRPIENWSVNATGKLIFLETKTLTPGKTYKLTVDYTVNGISQTQLSKSATCPK